MLGAGVPERVAVPLPIAVNVTPLGSCPDSESAGSGLLLLSRNFSQGYQQSSCPRDLK